MDVHSNATVSGNYVEDFLPCENMEGGDGVSLEWLSVFVEDCLNGGFSSQPLLPPPPPTTSHQTPTTSQAHQGPTTPILKAHKDPSGPVPSKARTKRRKISTNHNNPLHTFHVSSSDPPLLPQAYWLADSQLLTFPKKESSDNETEVGPQLKEEEEEEEVINNDEGQGPRRCTHCLSYKTPQWRTGPLGPKTLCNACGVRFKSGRLLPEYRPAKSPTFESFKHSNSHKKVMEMRMMSTLLPSHTN